ncbi:MAG TPA: hypothetical protein VHE34_10020 [Puia sp.]|uniref:ABC transporter permease/M1 family aminopeptidase n=1 Tax=Puia sp. TaxID=2045100 RepID=UPI002C9D3597|nr:hypothetical protein [Puia sp.]HVU95552.1 hypothetical protein [Puia sp.]
MLTKIFLFELRYKARQPIVYIYLLGPSLLTLLAFAGGLVAAGDGQFYNAPAVIERFSAMISILLLLPVSFLMGLSLYRDIEYHTREYYLSYPISERDYFWGRFLGSFFFVALSGLLILLGIFIGTRVGANTGWTPVERLGPDGGARYLGAFATILLPDFFFPACLFFGLVAVSRSIRVIYSGAVILLLAYLAARVYFDFTNNTVFSQLADPFAFNSVRLITGSYPPATRNSAVLPFSGLFLVNRLIWTVIGVLILFYTYSRFSFGRFLVPARERKKPGGKGDRLIGEAIKMPFILPRFGRKYILRCMKTLVRVEIKNFSRDIFFRIILAAYLLFLVFFFWLGAENYQVRDLPRTVALINSFKNDIFPYLFLVLIFYAGESVHRERSARFAVISDTFPPPDWVIYGSKAIALFLLGAFLILVPGVVIFLVQWAKDYLEFNAGLMADAYFTLLLPGVFQMAMLSLMVHVLINNKFAAHAAGILAWFTATSFLPGSMEINYHLLLFSVTPFFNYSDMEGQGHMAAGVHWFTVYWSLGGGILLWLGYLVYGRGVILSMGDRIRQLRGRIRAGSVLLAAVLVVLFLGCGGYIYYNVSYLNNYLTDKEEEGRMAEYEKKMSAYAQMPVPTLSRLKMDVDIFPGGHSMQASGHITFVNTTVSRIDSILLDGDRFTDYRVSRGGAAVGYTSPLLFPRGSYDFLRPAFDTSRCRVYHLTQPLQPGDSIDLELWVSTQYRGFCNDLYGTDILHNGTYLQGIIPVTGYDPGRQLTESAERKEFGLAPMAIIRPAVQASPLSMDITVSTVSDQVALAPGRVSREWSRGGRRYAEYKWESTVPAPYAVLSAAYDEEKDSVVLSSGRTIGIGIYHVGRQDQNTRRLTAALRDGLKYYSASFGDYPAAKIRLAETSNYGPYSAVYPGLITDAEYYAWNADLRNGIRPDGPADYCYFYTARQLAGQWWRFGYRPEAMKEGSAVAEGLSTYCALVLYDRRYGSYYGRALREQELSDYAIASSRDNQEPLLSSTRRYDQEIKAGFLLYGLKELIGEDSINTALREFADSCDPRRPLKGRAGFVLYGCLQKHVPDSFQYYLRDGWRRVTRYDNRIISATVVPSASSGKYVLTMEVRTEKMVMDDRDLEIPDPNMEDHIEIGAFGPDSADKEGLRRENVLFLKRMKFGPGVHRIEMILPVKPVRVAIDPYAKLIDFDQRDNSRNIF